MKSGEVFDGIKKEVTRDPFLLKAMGTFAVLGATETAILLGANLDYSQKIDTGRGIVLAAIGIGLTGGKIVFDAIRRSPEAETIQQADPLKENYNNNINKYII